MSLVISAKPHLLSSEGRYLGEIEQGKTIGEIVDMLDVSSETYEAIVVNIDGHVVARQMWDKTWPKDMTRLDICAMYRGGGSGKKVLAIAAMIAISFAAPYAAGAMVGLFNGGVASVALTTAYAAGFTMLGMLAVSALFAPPDESVKTSNDVALDRLTGQSNSARPDQGIMKIYGEMRVAPDVIGAPYISNVDGKSYLTAIYGFGYKNVETNLGYEGRVGALNLWEMEGVTWHYDRSWIGGDTLQFYTKDVHQESLQLTLFNDGPYEDSGPWPPPTDDSDYRIVRGEKHTVKTIMDLSLPGGCFKVDKDAEDGTASFRVDVWFLYRLVGNTTWLNTSGLTHTITSLNDEVSYIDDADGHGMRLHMRYEKTVSMLVTVELDMPEGQYEFKIGRSSHPAGRDDTPKSWDNSKIIVSNLKSVSTLPPIDTDIEISKMELKVKASGQVSGTISNLTTLCQAYIPYISDMVGPVWNVPSWNGSTWSHPWTNNPAWVYLDIMRSDANKNKVEDEDIILQDFWDWAAYCDQPSPSNAGKPFIACNFVHTGSETVDQILQKVASCGNATRTSRDGKQSIIWDKESLLPRQVFTSRNSWGFNLEKSFVVQPDGMKVSFRNEDNDFKPDEVIAYSPGFDEFNASKFEQMEAFGSTEIDQSRRVGERFLAMGRHRNEFFSLSADIENISSERGDHVRVAYASVKEGGISGRIVELISTTSVRLDQKHGAPSGSISNHGLLIRTVKNSEPYVYVEPVASITDEYTVSLSSAIDSVVNVGDLIAFGVLEEIEQDYLITKVNPGDSLSASIECTPYAPEMQEIRNGGTKANTCNLEVVAIPARTVVGEIVSLSSRTDTDSVASYTWSIPGSNTPNSNSEFVGVTYASAGVYTVTLNVNFTSGGSCEDTMTVIIDV